MGTAADDIAITASKLRGIHHNGKAGLVVTQLTSDSDVDPVSTGDNSFMQIYEDSHCSDIKHFRFAFGNTYETISI